MNQPEEEALLIAEAIKQYPRELAGQWQMRPAGITSGTAGGVQALARIDGDTSPTRVISLAGELFAGDRVMTIAVPPEGVYVISVNLAGTGWPNEESRVITNMNDSETSASFTDMSAGGTVTLPFTKEREGSRIWIFLAAGAFASDINTIVEYAFRIKGTDYPVASFYFNTTFDHRHFSGGTHVSGIAAGDATATLRWRRSAGAGTLFADGNDRYTMYMKESR